MEAPSFDEYKGMLLERFRNDTSTRPECWKIADNLVRKVSKEGKLQPFYGYTSIFTLSEDDAGKCRGFCKTLFDKAGDLLIPLPVSSFHLTLHTFWNQNNCASISEVDRKMEISRPLIEETMDEIMKRYGNLHISMFSPGISTNGSDVVSMKFIPQGKEDFELLYSLFLMMERICPLSQQYIPHISLAYFKVRNYDKDEIKQIYDAIDLANDLGHGHTAIDIPVSSLRFKMHRMMDGYMDVCQESHQES